MSIATELTRLQTAKANIKTSIENKGVTVSSDALLDAYPALIDSISTGSPEENEVNFYDYDGTLLYSYTLAEAQALTALPDLPDHSDIGLDKDSQYSDWNWTLADIQALSSGSKADIGANLDTDDGYTHIYVEIPDDSLTWVLGLSSADSVDWGDGTTETSISTKIAHTYSTGGEYEIILNKPNWAGTEEAHLWPGNVSPHSTNILTGTVKRVQVGSNGAYGQKFGYAYEYYTNLTSISIPSNIKVDSFAFSQDYNLGYVVIPRQNLTSSGVFGRNSYVKKFITPPNLSLVDYNYYNAVSIRDIDIPDGITSIPSNAFYSCYSLTSITIPDTVTTINENAFQGCYSLTSITIPNGITSIGDAVFQSCYSLTSITIPSGITSISNFMFNSCYSLTSITIPDTVTTIGNNVFQNCINLASITIPDEVTSIGNRAFSSCQSLTAITMKPTTPPTLNNTNAIPTNANLKIYVPSGTLADYQAATNWSSFASYMEELS